MPVIYVGRTTNYCGKPLWEILGNLKNFGVGRLVKRHTIDRYSEPTFFRIVKVDAVDVEHDVNRRLRAWVEKVFRGRRYPKLVELHRVSYKTDYKLIPKCEEKELWDKVNALSLEEKILPTTKLFPPLLSEIIKEEMKAKGETVKEPRLKLNIKPKRDNFYKLAKENEVPTTEFHHLSDIKQFDLK